MSRSYRKHLVITDGGPHNKSKRFANHVVRKCWDVNSGGAYKRLYETWSICDWKIWYDPNWGTWPVWKWRSK